MTVPMNETRAPGRLEAMATQALSALGTALTFLAEAVAHIAQGRINWRLTLAQTAAIGFDSAPMSIIICLVAGSVLALQTAAKFAQTGADAYVGGLVALAIVREIGPIFTCMAVGARAGTAIAAEIANMKVTEQIDALTTMNVSPVRYLFVPRLLACVVALPLLTIVDSLIAIIGGMLIAQNVSYLHYSKYLESVWLYLKPYDIRVSLIKSMIFGVILAAICCTIGLTTRGGAKDVGEATTRAAVWTVVAILIADFFLTWMFFGSSFQK
ncbi:MAG: ABC transporter permease [Vampirovibrionales bacterium]|nr:ABC transporter permease [Vampirovibrionales bacterium]